MYVSCVHVHVKSNHIQDFIDATSKNHEGSLKEPGNMRFDILQRIEDPTRFIMYEAYESEEAAKAHKTTPHYLEWRKRVEDYMAEPRVGIPHRVIVPKSRDQW